mmetsp:Transcript_2919/g.4880  ORF Transcript_2919/g.4880 Transcript_2919/m.4880 type:complete len:1045 (+) Transcript_2919:75-3209(+)
MADRPRQTYPYQQGNQPGRPPMPGMPGPPGPAMGNGVPPQQHSGPPGSFRPPQPQGMRPPMQPGQFQPPNPNQFGAPAPRPPSGMGMPPPQGGMGMGGARPPPAGQGPPMGMGARPPAMMQPPRPAQGGLNGMGGGPPPPQPSGPVSMGKAPTAMGAPKVTGPPMPSMGGPPGPAAPVRPLVPQPSSMAVPPRPMYGGPGAGAPSQPSFSAPPPASMQSAPQAPGFAQGFNQGPPQQQQQGYPQSSQPAPPAFGGQMGSYGAQRPGMSGTESILGQFQSLTMSGGPVAPGQPADVGVDAASFPRPVGSDVDGVLESLRWKKRDPYSADVKFMRLSSNAIPNSVELKKQWCLPCSALIQPLADIGKPVPVVNFGVAGIIRCRQCRTYVNPYVQFTDGGRRWKCNVCGTFNEVPVEYFCTTDNTGIRRDIAERPELNCGSVEYLAPEEYMVRPPMPPTYVFAFDVSYPAIASGLLATAIDSVKSCLDSLPGAERTQVGIITYDSTVHFYNMRGDQSSPQMLVIPDAASPYLPQPDDLLVNLQECRSQIDAALDIISKAFGKTQNVEGNIGGAVQSAYLVMQHVGGKMLCFQSSVPTAGEGKLRPKEDLASYNTEREYKLRKAEDPFFKRFGGECNRIQMCIDIFCCPPKFTDVASLSVYSSATGGQFYFYPGFFARKDGMKLKAEVTRNLTRETGWEAVMRVRMGKGLKCTNFHGHFMIRSNDLMALPTVDPDKAMHVDIGYEEQMVPHQMTYMQCALLYTTSQGERRIRVHTMAIPVVSDIGELFKACDSCATSAILSKLAAEKIRSTTIKETIHILNKKVIDVLKEYRQLYSTHLHPHNKLILPETMKMLPLLMLCMQKGALLKSPNEVTTDERSNTIYQILSMPFDNIMKFFYPRMYPLHDLGQIVLENGAVTSLPPTLPLTLNSIKDSGIYLLDNGMVCYLWIGRAISPQWLIDVFGLQNPTPQDLMNLQVGATLNNDTSKKVVGAVNKIRENNIYFQQCYVVRQGDPAEAMILPWLVEDKLQTLHSYTNYLGYIHKGILTR